jgi:hypothetical protein
VVDFDLDRPDDALLRVLNGRGADARRCNEREVRLGERNEVSEGVESFELEDRRRARVHGVGSLKEDPGEGACRNLDRFATRDVAFRIANLSRAREGGNRHG